MDKVRVFLRTDLFTVGGELRHAPDGACILDGRVREQSAGGFIVEVARWYRADGRPLEGGPAVLYLPTGKVDHLLLLAEGT